MTSTSQLGHSVDASLPWAAMLRPGTGRTERRSRQASLALGCYAVTLFVFPADMVVRVIGGQGYVAGLTALLLFLVWLFSTLLRVHNPFAVRYPTRALLALFAGMSLLSWAMTPFHGLTSGQQLGADRWIMMIAGCAGVVLVAGENLTSVRDLMTVLRAATTGGAFCGLVAVVQWVLRIDISGVIRQSLPGFSVDDDSAVYQARGALERVTGTAVHPIELGVVAGMVLPIAVVVAMHDHTRSAARRWIPILLIALAIPASVSRAAVLSVAISMVILIVSLPPRPRVTALVLAPAGAFLLVLLRPGYLTTLAGFIGEGKDDSSVAARLVDYPMVERMVSEHPWFGTGGGTFVFHNAIEILDNQYLKSAIELGLVGILGLLSWFVGPVFVGIAARRRATDPVLRSLAGALTGAAAAGAVASYTFDSLSFNLFAGLETLVVASIGASWVLASGRTERSALPALLPLGS